VTQDAINDVLPELYEQLRQIAHSLFKAESSRHTLEPTAVVNEAYLKLIEQSRTNWKSRGHICSVAAMMMRRILVDHARQRCAEKRGGDFNRVDSATLDQSFTFDKHEEVLEIDELLQQLSDLNQRHARIAELKYFAGLTIAQTAETLEVSEFTVKNDWRIARAWLLAKLNGSLPKDA